MSVYSDISKEIGWYSFGVGWPTLEEAKALLTKVKVYKDSNAFKQVFNYYRNGDMAKGDDDLVKVFDLLLEAFNEGKRIFK